MQRNKKENKRRKIRAGHQISAANGGTKWWVECLGNEIVQ